MGKTGKIRVGVIGLGYWGSKVAREYRGLVETGKIASVVTCDLNPETKPDFSDYKAFMKEVDAIHICTPNQSHFRMAKAFMKAGKHVLIEKPMTTDLVEANWLCHLSKLHKVVMQSGLIWMHDFIIHELKRIMSVGDFGKIYALKFRWHVLQKQRELEPDIIWDLLPHPLSIALYFLENNKPMLGRKLTGRFTRDTDDIAFIVMYIGDTLISIELSHLQNPKTRTMEIVGSNMCATVELPLSRVTLYPNNREPARTYQVETNTIGHEIQHFINTIEGSEYKLIPEYCPVDTGEMGVKITKIIEELLELD